jgi:hypothetical protein
MCVNLEASHFGNSAPLELLVPVEKPEAVAEMGDCIFDPIVTAIAISQSHFPNCGRVSNCLGPCASLLSPSAIICYALCGYNVRISLMDSGIVFFYAFNKDTLCVVLSSIKKIQIHIIENHNGSSSNRSHWIRPTHLYFQALSTDSIFLE